MTLRVGQKVVCIDVSGLGGGCHIRLPQLRSVYIIRDFFIDPMDGAMCVRLAEIANPPGFCIETGEICEPYFLARRFRPIVKTKTDISIFKKMLTPKRENA